LSIAVAVALLALPAAAARADDDFNTPDPISLGSPVDDDNTAATEQVDEPLTEPGGDTCADGGGKVGATLWYEFTGTGREVRVSIDAPTTRMVVAAYDAASPPSIADLIACDDTSITPGSDLVFDTTAGESYLLQVGGYDAPSATPPEVGAFSFTADSPPGNDDRADAAALALGSPLDADNIGAGVESGEDVLCEDAFDAPLGKTVWFKFGVAEQGRVGLHAGGFDTVMQLYRAGEQTPFACSDDTNDELEAGIVALLAPGEYLVQIGGYGGDEGELTLESAFALDLDRDSDGSNRPFDCDDADGGRRPGNFDFPDNGVDEDCSGADGHVVSFPGAVTTTFPVLGAGYALRTGRDGLTLRRLAVTRTQRGMRIRLSCRGRRCFRALDLTARGPGTVDLLSRIARRYRKRPHGSTIVLRVTHAEADRTGRITTFKFRRKRSVSVARACIDRATDRTIPCP
jgi:hypothetical protein